MSLEEANRRKLHGQASYLWMDSKGQLRRMKVSEMKKAVDILESEPGYEEARNILKAELKRREAVNALRRNIRRLRSQEKRIGA